MYLLTLTGADKRIYGLLVLEETVSGGSAAVPVTCFPPSTLFAYFLDITPPSLLNTLHYYFSKLIGIITDFSKQRILDLMIAKLFAFYNFISFSLILGG